ncbi:hypothetical protein F383_37833 [Gossypium arboreum]|uniref:Uncharacterized protein n=1 Tax=Gossypium arboreum TaxID=29729 RepID=A0A0B0MDQ2_GOSAR|nr:hypothetical protein F383_37833 [Gossypium arboreum]
MWEINMAWTFSHGRVTRPCPLTGLKHDLHG